MLSASTLLAAALSPTFLILAWVAVLAAVALAFIYARRARVIRTRLQLEHQVQLEPLAPVPTEDMWWMRRWLYVAGYRRAEALPLFIGLAVTSFILGLAIALTIRASTYIDKARLALYDLPGGIGTLMEPVLVVTPWVVFVLIASIPWLVVRRRRRKRVNEIEEDLPITLQLLATLSRAGLGLDAAMLRVLESSNPERTLPQELQTFRREQMAGISRVECWRRLGRRVDVSAISIFVSAMIHAEQVGGGVSDVLDHQTEDVQSRRRERALIKAHALPVKLVFPLVICFLPGIFVWTLGPAFYRFIQVIDSVTNQSSGLAP